MGSGTYILERFTVGIRDRLAAGIRHGPVALDVPDDAAGSVADLHTPPVARVTWLAVSCLPHLRHRISDFRIWICQGRSVGEGISHGGSANELRLGIPRLSQKQAVIASQLLDAIRGDIP